MGWKRQDEVIVEEKWNEIERNKKIRMVEQKVEQWRDGRVCRRRMAAFVGRVMEWFITKENNGTVSGRGKKWSEGVKKVETS